MKRTKKQLHTISRNYANNMKQKYYDVEKVLGLDKIKYHFMISEINENKKKVLRKKGYNIWLILNLKNLLQNMVLPLIIKEKIYKN